MCTPVVYFVLTIVLRPLLWYNTWAYFLYLKQGCPIYGKIRFVRNFIACFSLRTKNDLWPNLRIFSYSSRLLCPIALSRSRYSTKKNTIFFTNLQIFVRTEFGYYHPPPPPPPPDCRLGVFRARRVNLQPSELFRLLPEMSGFFGIPIGQPCFTSQINDIILKALVLR